jgi:hypothetical protein
MACDATIVVVGSLLLATKFITKVKTYLDSAMVTQLFRENSIFDR